MTRLTRSRPRSGGKQEVEGKIERRRALRDDAVDREHVVERSRRHGTVVFPAVIFSPARSTTGPVGLCSPGIHFG